MATTTPEPPFQPRSAGQGANAARANAAAAGPPTASHLSLPKLERTGPRRLVATVGRFDDAPAPEASRSPEPGRPLVSARDVIEHGIRVAQEVIDQQLGSGERILRHLRKAPIRKRRISPLDAQGAASLTERTVVLFRELNVLTLELLETLAETPTVVRVLGKWLGLEWREDGGGGSPSGGDYRAGPAVPQCDVQISSRQPAKVDVTWFAGAVPDDAQVLELHQPDAPPIRSVQFIAEMRAFRISIPDDQPCGTYSGVIVSRDTGRALGTMIATVYGD